ncbi:MAG TPA: restriction endonuclease [Candidatus Marinimicrobia bacterium]|nr:restriction endonuclease [Candidatus Neomarinimicrobiota bacterium]
MIIVIGIIVIVWSIGKIFKYLYQKRAAKIDSIKNKLKEIEEREEKLEEFKSQNEQDKEAIRIIAEEKSKGFSWLAKAYADYFYLQNLKVADYLEHKSHPAQVSAEKVREIARQRRIIEEKLRIAQGIIFYYQDLFPFLDDFLGDIDEETLKRVLSRNIENPIKDVGEIGIDPARIILRLSEEDFQKLSTTERNQRALNIYWTKPKNNWQLGRDYERYIGYIYESNGYKVDYKGILEGFDDLGRDLICKKGFETIIIQCKRWSQHKIIHEKHVNQLYGTVVKYIIDSEVSKQSSLFPPQEKVSAFLYTTTKLSERAKEFADHLSIGIVEEYPLPHRYSCIKCNISLRTGEKIYHLPFDQQYDSTIIEEEKNECYVETVKEAENLGYRRAWRWRGKSID